LRLVCGAGGDPGSHKKIKKSIGDADPRPEGVFTKTRRRKIGREEGKDAKRGGNRSYFTLQGEKRMFGKS